MIEQSPFHDPAQRGIVPAVTGWRTFRGALANFLLFGFVAFAGEWIVHQTQYLIEYGGSFGMVLSNTSHGVYMGPVGLVLILAMLCLLLLFGIVSHAAQHRRAKLLRLAPPRLHRFVPDSAHRVPWNTILITGVALAVVQATVYVFQENLEYASITGAWPGLWVLFAPQHISVLSLDLIVALTGSLLLWAFASHVRGARRAVKLVEALARLILAPRTAPIRLIAPIRHIPQPRLRAGVRGLRAPPFVA